MVARGREGGREGERGQKEKGHIYSYLTSIQEALYLEDATPPPPMVSQASNQVLSTGTTGGEVAKPQCGILLDAHERQRKKRRQ